MARQIGKQSSRVRELMEKIHAETQARIEQEERERKEQPRRAFIAAARAVGFTERQAEFLWNEIPDTQWMNRYRPIGGSRG